MLSFVRGRFPGSEATQGVPPLAFPALHLLFAPAGVRSLEAHHFVDDTQLPRVMDQPGVGRHFEVDALPERDRRAQSFRSRERVDHGLDHGFGHGFGRGRLNLETHEHERGQPHAASPESRA